MSTRNVRLVGRVEQPDVGAALVDDARAVRLRVARVIDVVIGVAALVRAVGPARVKIAHALAIGEEVDALADPHRTRDVARQLLHAAEISAAVRVDPQMPRGAAAVALPARRVGGVAPDDHGLAGAVGQVIDLAVGKHFRQPAIDGKRERAVVAEERLPVRRDEQDAALRRPAAHEHVRAEPRHPPRGTALGGHQIDLGVLLVAADVGDPLAIRREHRRRRFSQSRREAPRRAAGGIHAPEIVVADEDDGVAHERRLAQVALLGHEFNSSFAGGSRKAGRDGPQMIDLSISGGTPADVPAPSRLLPTLAGTGRKR